MQRYILNNETKLFSENDKHHIKNVMRMKENDFVVICYNDLCFKAKLIFINNDITYEIVEELESDNSFDITLIQGYLKGTKIETTIKYSTIFGARTIILSEFDRSIAKIKNIDHKLDRYNQIAKEAAELSKRNYQTNILIEEKLSNINYSNFDLILLADEEEESLHLNKINLKDYKDKRIAIIIGPEGGITNNERKLFKSKGAKSITLGRYIFPAEIASLSLLAVFNNILLTNE